MYVKEEKLKKLKGGNLTREKKLLRRMKLPRRKRNLMRKRN